MQPYFAVLPLVLGVLGCSADLPYGPVTGRVTIDGQAITAGRVTIAAKDLSHSASGELTPEGTYTIADAPYGAVMVAVRTKDRAFQMLPAAVPPTKLGGGSADFMPSQKPNPLYVPIPERYEDMTTSGLEVTIPKAGRTFVYDIPLTR